MTNLPDTRLSLLVRLQSRRDEEAWGEFLADYEPFLLGMFRRRGLQEADVRDVTQQVLVSIASNVGRWQPDGQAAPFRRWITTIARNAAIRHLSRSAQRPVSGLPEQFASIGQPSSTERAEREYQQEILAWAIQQVRDEFQPTTWQAFWETSVQLRPIAEVARELAISTGAVYMARSRVMARLREKTGHFDPDLHESEE
ncbi:sigma-70 family RNA polymerase sigma factor [bacterium]|nr:sigma-70 family RNA polymerase sigma factor [bacterium]